MLYPPSEHKLFQRQIARFKELYRKCMERSIEIFEEKSKVRDTTTPIWHTYEYPGAFLHQLQQKTARCHSAWQAAQDGQITREEAMQEFLREMPDIRNYAAFLEVITHIFLEEEGKGEVRVLGTGDTEQPKAADARSASSVPPRPSTHRK